MILTIDLSQLRCDSGGSAVPSWTKSPLDTDWSSRHGFGASIGWNGTVVEITVDRVRSVPVFYSLRGDRLTISDDPIEMLDAAQPAEVDRQAAAQMLDMGFCIGSKTLIAGIDQVPAGCAVTFGPSGIVSSAPTLSSQFSGECDRWDAPKQRGDSLDEFDHVNFVVFSRLAQLLGDRPALVPLSGGMDSRLVACWLKKMGVRRVVTFTYGTESDPETQESQRVADALGLEWRFFPYTEVGWQTVARSEAFQKFLRFGGSLSAIPHVQDFPALAQLAKDSTLANAVVVPGHSGDFVAGSHLEEHLLARPSTSSRRVEQALRRRHGSVTPPSIVERTTSVSTREIRRGISVPPTLPSRDAVALLDDWDLAERQAKFVVNSVRAYESHGFSWWLPQWDHEYVDFFRTLPLDDRRECSLYSDYCSELFDAHGVSNRVTPRSSFASKLARSSRHKAGRSLTQVGLRSRGVKDAEFHWGVLRTELCPQEASEMSHSHINSAVGLTSIRAIQDSLART